MALRRASFVVGLELLLCPWAFSQLGGPDKSAGFVISGDVVEPGTLKPVPDATVTLYPPVQGVQAQGAIVSRRASTDAKGNFVFKVDRLGTYRVQVGKEGYWSPAPASGDPEKVVLDSAHPSRQLRFRLTRSGEISGYVVDKETGKPLPMLLVRVVRAIYTKGHRAIVPGNGWFTDPDGRFVVLGLRPSEYLIGIGLPMTTQERFLASFSEGDLAVSDWGYEQTYWPGGSDLNAALPVVLNPGESIDLGHLRAAKAVTFRVHVSLLPGNCEPDEVALVHVAATPGIWQTADNDVARVPCGDDFLMRSFPPGAYHLETVVGDQEKGQRARGDALFEVIDKNVELAVALTKGVELEGRIVAAEGSSKPALEKMQVGLHPTGFFADDVTSPIDDQGRFHLANVAAREQHLTVQGLAGSHYVREVRLDGRRVSDGIMALDGTTPVSALEIVVDDKPATIIGTVTDRDKPVSQAHVVLVQWPPNPLDLFFSVSTSGGDENGRFTFSGLAPGDYRILAVSPEAKGKLEEPRVLEGLLAGAEKLNLTERAVRQLNLTQTNP